MSPTARPPRHTEKSEATSALTTESESAVAASRSGSERSFVHAPPQDDAVAGKPPPVKGVRRGLTVFVHHNDDGDNDKLDDAAAPTSHKTFPKGTDDMRVKMALALEEHLQDHPVSVRARYAHSLDFESASPKPCITPGNALQLIDEGAHTPSPVIIINSGGGQVNLQSTSHDSPSDPETTGSSIDPEQVAAYQRRPAPRVRFRSRVRITSGLRKHRHSTSSAGIAGNETPSTCSSCSGSPSSSISAPLRWHADENGAWGPLGRRLSAYAHGNGSQKRSSTSPKQNGVLSSGSSGSKTDERTPLINSHRARVAYVDSGLDGGGETDDERLVGGDHDEDEEETEEQSLRALALKREEDAVFGKWPWRLFNRHWWWWHVEPALCCCSDDSDYDEFQ